MPGLAVADHLRDFGWRVVWMGNPDGMEARLVPGHGYETAWVRFSALRGKGLLRKLMLPLNLLRGLVLARRVFKRIQPDVVIGFGGFVTFPGGMMAWLTGRPLVLHEQNSIPGLANKVLARLAKRVLTGFPEVFKSGEWCGNPVRPPIAALVPPEQRFSGRVGPLRILVVGGSLGAQSLNEAVPLALALIPAEERPEVVHQSGEKQLDLLKENYQRAGVTAHTVAFIEDMAGAYEWADLVICRAGALTIAELAAAGAASILVPYPHAVDDHQTANAQFLVSDHAAWVRQQKDLTPEWLAQWLGERTRQELAGVAARARTHALPKSAERIADICEELAGANP